MFIRERLINLSTELVIAIPTYNRLDLLKKLVDTIPSYVGISISDNGHYIQNNNFFNKKNIKITSHDQVLDMFDNWNSSIIESEARDGYIAITSDDDIYLKGSFDIISTYLNNKKADIYIFGHHIINSKDEIKSTYCPKKLEYLQAPYGFEKFKYEVKARMPSIFFKKEFLDEIGYFDSKIFSITAADSELIQRALIKGRVAFIPEVVSAYRVWEGNFTNALIATSRWLEEIDSWTSKVADLENVKIFKSKKEELQYKDEIYAQNLLAGLYNLYHNQEYEKLKSFYNSSRRYKNAFLKTRIRIILVLLKSVCRNFYAS